MKTSELCEMVVAIPKNETEEIRVIKKEYKGKTYFDIREYFLIEGVPLPTRRGLTISEAVFNQLRESI